MQLAALLIPLLTMQGGKLQVTDVKVGTGPAAKSGDLLAMDYTGTLLNGKQFDSSIGKTPFVFQLGGGMVIKGWDQGVVGMKVGGKRMLVIPADLAYGNQAMGSDIPANSTLKFTIELRGIYKPKIEVLKAGHGDPIKAHETVSLHFKLSAGGKVIANSYEKGKPMTLQAGAMQPPMGFFAAFIGLKEGEKVRYLVPWMYGLGAEARGPIPAKSDLTCEVEVLKVNR